MKKKIAIIILGLSVALSVMACGNKDNVTETTETDSTVEVKENINKEEDTSKEKDRFEKSIQLTSFDEISNYTDKFDTNSIKGIHLDDLVLTMDEFALTNKEDYDTVLAKVSEGKEAEKDIAGNIKIKFSDFELEYTKSYQNGSCVGVAVSVEPIGENCKGFYIECADSDWYIGDNFLIYSEYPDYSDVLEEVYNKIEVDEAKLTGGGIVGIWNCIGTSDNENMESIYVFYNDNTGVKFANHVVNCNFTYEIQDDETMLVNYFPERGGEGRIEHYTLNGDTWSWNAYNDKWLIYTRVK